MKIFKNTSILVISLLLFSSLLTTSNTLDSKADPIIKLVQNIEIEWENSEIENIPIIPRDELRIINVTITYTMDHGLPFSEGMYLNYINYEDISGGNAFSGESLGRVILQVVETPEWCHATFRRPILPVNITSKYIAQMPLYILIDEDAPAYEIGDIKVKAQIKPFPTVPYITGDEKIEVLSFQPAYNPIISVDLPDINTKQIEPSKTANFPIKITNIGNDQTVVKLKVESIPSGWSATLTNEIILDKEESNTAYLSIITPKDFGYREDLGIVRISLTPVRALNESEVGDELSLSFLVQSKGFFMEGQGIFTFVIIIILLVFIVLVIRFIARRKFKDLY